MSTTRRRFLGIGRDIAIGLGAGGLLALPAGCDEDAEATAPPPPPPPPPPPEDGWKNIVLFVVDDMGVTDCGHCGSDYYRTPAMDRMAREGVRFAQAYSPSPLCSASRAAIHTGKYPHRLGITGAIVCRGDIACEQLEKPQLKGGGPYWQKVVTPSFLGQLPLGERTIAEYLRDAGYATAHIGKWHLGGAEHNAAAQGFTHVIGGGPENVAPPHFSPYGLPGITDGPPGEYLSDRLTAESISFIHANRDVPFFLSLAHYGVHLPLQAPLDIARLYVGPSNTDSAQRNPVYAAMIEKVDQSLAALLNTLDALDLSGRTLVVVTSDNGGYMQVAHQQYLERVTSNGPYRGGKASLYEGGIRVPLLMRGGARIRQGSVCDVPVSGIDLLPTVLALAGHPLADLAGAIDGKNLLPMIESGTLLPARALFWHYPHYTPMRVSTELAIDEHVHTSLPSTAVRSGDFKLMRVYGEGDGFGFSDELYNLVADAGETSDIAASQPELVATLSALLAENIRDTGALVPIANPLYREFLEGWRVDRDCSASIGHGILRVTAGGPYPQLGSEKILVGESFLCRVRMRSSGTLSLVLNFTTRSDARVFSTADCVAVSVPPATEFVDVDFSVPVQAGVPVTWLRLGPGVNGSVTEIDSVQILAAADNTRVLYQWHFSGVTGLRYGGSWFSATDTFVACGPGSLQIDMPGSAPAIMSPVVTLFGPLRVKLRLRSTGAGFCSLAWLLQQAPTPPPAPMQLKRTIFPVPHDGVWHEHTVLVDERSDEAIQCLLLSLGNASGVAEIDYIHVFDTQDSLVAVWDFCSGQTA